MKIINLTENSTIYTSNVYLVLGSWNTLKDVNTLVDVGRDPMMIDMLNEAPTGVGKKKVDQVVFTHNHYDHTAMLGVVLEKFSPAVCAFSSFMKKVDRVLKDGDKIQMGDREFEVLHVPGHSQDSICLYNNQEKILFAGDTPLIIRHKDSSYDENFITALKRISSRKINTIYFGHGKPLTKNCDQIIRNSLHNINCK